MPGAPWFSSKQIVRLSISCRKAVWCAQKYLAWKAAVPALFEAASAYVIFDTWVVTWHFRRCCFLFCSAFQVREREQKRLAPTSEAIRKKQTSLLMSAEQIDLWVTVCDTLAQRALAAVVVSTFLESDDVADSSIFVYYQTNQFSPWLWMNTVAVIVLVASIFLAR